MEAPLVELVEYDQAETLQRGVGLEHPGEHPLRNYHDSRARPHHGFMADAIPDRLPQSLPENRCHAARGRPGREPLAAPA